MGKLEELIRAQQKGHENAPRFMIGEQLLEIAAREPFSAELLERDLQIKEMTLEAAEKHFQEYADKNHKGAKTFCITPKTAEELLRKFYGLPKPEEGAGTAVEPAPKHDEDFIDLSSYL